MLINNVSTIGDLALLRCKYGVVKMSIVVDFMMLETVLVTLFTGGADDFRVIGRGETEAIALDDAFGRLLHRTGHVISEALADGDTSTPMDPNERGET